MNSQKIDLRGEQQKTLETPRYKYSFMARFFFFSLNLVTGKITTCQKSNYWKCWPQFLIERGNPPLSEANQKI